MQISHASFAEKRCYKDRRPKFGEVTRSSFPMMIAKAGLRQAVLEGAAAAWQRRSGLTASMPMPRQLGAQLRALGTMLMFRDASIEALRCNAADVQAAADKHL
jgi:hypothetical protein